MSSFDNDLASATDAVLAVAQRRMKQMINALSMADLADMRIADGGSDAVLDRNFMRTQSARQSLAKIEAEIARRASINAASDPKGQASAPLSDEAGHAPEVPHE